MVTPKRERNPAPSTTTFKSAAERYIAEGGPEKHLISIVEYLGEKTIGEIDDDDEVIEGAVNAIGPHLSLSSAESTIIKPIQTVLNHAFDRGRRRGPGKKPSRWLTPDEAERLIEAASNPQRVGLRDPQLRTLQKISFMLGTGAVPGEVITIDGSAYNRETETWSLPGVPSIVRPRILRPPRRAIELIGDVPLKGPAFLAPNGQPYVVRTKGGGQMAEAFSKVRDAAGLDDEITPATCRTTWAVWLYAQVPDLDVLVGMGGWAGPRSPKPLTKLIEAGLGQWIMDRGWDFRESVIQFQGGWS